VLHGLHAAHEATDERGASLQLVHRDVSPGNVLVGGDGARKSLAEPLADTLYFAGEATDAEESGTVGGALQSGVRAAREIIKRGDSN